MASTNLYKCKLKQMASTNFVHVIYAAGDIHDIV